jgi:hypothetical protein
MRAQDGTVGGRQLWPPGDTHHDDSIGEDRRLLWLVCQGVNAAEADEECPRYHQQDDPSPAV